MIMKNSTNFYSKEVTAAMLKVKTEYRMATAMAKLKTATEMRHSLEEQKKTQGRYHDTNPPPSTRKSSRTTSQILLNERNSTGSAKSSKCAKCKISLASHWVNLELNL